MLSPFKLAVVPVVRLALLVSALVATETGNAQAQPAVDAQARAEYDAGAKAYEAKDFSRAAVSFAHADELAPNPLALKLGLAAATQADDAVLGMTLVLRAEARAVDGSLADVARHARGRFAGRVGMLRVACVARGGCHAVVQGRRAGDGQLLVVAPGEVDAVIEDGDTTARVHATVAARSVVELVEPPVPSRPGQALAPIGASPPPVGPRPAADVAPDRPPAETPGLSPVFFWSGMVLSGALGGITLASGLDTLAKHDTFHADPTAAQRDRGVSAENRTNVLLISTAGVAIVTLVVGVFFTRWRSAPGPSRLAAVPGAATIHD